LLASSENKKYAKDIAINTLHIFYTKNHFQYTFVQSIALVLQCLPASGVL